MMVSNWLGLWESSKKGIYCGQDIRKTDIPKNSRILFCKNHYFVKGGNRPEYLYCFATADSGTTTEVSWRPYKDKNGDFRAPDGSRLFTYEEVEHVMREAAYDVQRLGASYEDILVRDYIDID